MSENAQNKSLKDAKTTESDSAPATDYYFQEAIAMKEKLNKVSSSFCLAKWLQVSIHLTTGRTHSCYHPISHRIPLEEIKQNPSALHNTQHKKLQRMMMLEGQRPKECSYCWAVEDLKNDHLSDRFFRSSESWASERFEEVAKSAWDYDVVPAYVEVNFNQACQFKCAYCSPALSSSWEQDIRKNGIFPTRNGHVPISYLEQQGQMPIPLDQFNPYVEAFWNWWPTLYPKLKVFRMTGGEPLLDENTFRVLEYAKAHPNPELSLSITSNMCPPDKNFARFLDSVQNLYESHSIKEFLLFVSLDSTAKQAEYIRIGLNFDKLYSNLCQFLDRNPRSSVSIINTFNALSVVGFPRFLEMIKKLRETYSKDWERIHFDTPRLNSPPFLSCKILSEEYLDLLESHIQLMKDQGFNQTEIEKIERLHEWSRIPENETDLKNNRIDFALYFQEHDRRRQLSFLNTFPEMTNFWKLCSDLAETYKIEKQGKT